MILFLQNCTYNFKKAFKLKVNINSFNRVESNMAILKNYLQKFKVNLKSNKSLAKRKLIWQDLDSCFNDIIKTGIKTNLYFKDPKEFLNKAFKLFSTRTKKSCNIIY